MHKSIAIVLSAAFALAAIHAAPLLAAVVPPVGLAPGSQYQLIFVTADSRTATPIDPNATLDDYNSFAANEAALNPSLPAGLTWKAVGSTRLNAAHDNAPSEPGSLPVYNTHGLEVASAATGLYTPTLFNAIEFDQFGNPTSSPLVWTGSEYTGFGVPSYELGASGAAGATVGNPLATDNTWARDGGITENPELLYPIYALSSPITVPVPEPSTFVMLSVGAILGLLTCRRWRFNHPV